MINRDNWLDRKAYLQYCEEVLLCSERTVSVRKLQLRHLLEWADGVRLTEAPSIRPTLPLYLASPDRGLKHSYQGDVCEATRLFFGWAIQGRNGYRRFPPVWLSSLRPPKSRDAGPQEREVWTLEDVRAVATCELPTLTLKRDQAAVVMLFLSAMRIGAFVTLPVKAVDLEEGSVKQWPSLGVHTKFYKAATTYLLPIPDLIDVVGEWDRLVRDRLGPDAPWYAQIDPATGDLAEQQEPKESQARNLRRGMRKLCDLAGVEYRRPHALRHGHVIYAQSRITTFEGYKALSQNLMHKSVKTTDEIYGILPEDSTRDRILGLTEDRTNTTPADDDLRARIERLERRPAQEGT